jgi:hypothetical protein
MATQSYQCPICKKKYQSPVRLSAAPVCTNGNTHRPTDMQERS